MVWDYTCVDTLCASHVPTTSLEAGKAAQQAERKKLAHYSQLQGAGYLVKLIATETLGSWGPDSLKFKKQIGARIADATGEGRSTSFLMQAISIAIQRGNAAAIAGTVPNAKELDEIYYL